MLRPPRSEPCRLSGGRLARLYSVVIPALLLTYVFDQIGMRHNPASYDTALETSPLLRILSNGLFLSRSWGWNLEILSDIPFWSLPHELWHYQLLAAAIFFKGYKRIFLIAAATLVASPAIMSYLPLWLAGVLAYRVSRKWTLNNVISSVLFVSSVLGIAIVVIAEQKRLIHRSDPKFLPRGYHPADYVLSALVALNIPAAAGMKVLPGLGKLSKRISAWAGVTFALYLLHLPLFHLIAAFMPSALSVTQRGAIVSFFTLITA